MCTVQQVFCFFEPLIRNAGLRSFPSLHPVVSTTIVGKDHCASCRVGKRERLSDRYLPWRSGHLQAPACHVRSGYSGKRQSLTSNPVKPRQKSRDNGWVNFSRRTEKAWYCKGFPALRRLSTASKPHVALLSSASADSKQKNTIFASKRPKITDFRSFLFWNPLWADVPFCLGLTRN